MVYGPIPHDVFTKCRTLNLDVCVKMRSKWLLIEITATYQLQNRHYAAAYALRIRPGLKYDIL